MAESITQQDLENVKEDIEDIGQSSNERMVINPRYGAPYKSIPLLSDELQDAIETAASAGAGENGWTDLLIQTADGSTQRAKNDSFQSQINSKASIDYVDSQDASLQSQIDQKATAAYLDNALAEQTQTVNTALSQLSTQATKFYPTLAEANADIVNLALNQPVQVGEAENGGLYYKATAEATTLTKSAYDPVSQSKKFVIENIIGINMFTYSEFYTSFFVNLGSNRLSNSGSIQNVKTAIIKVDPNSTYDIENFNVNDSGAFSIHESDTKSTSDGFLLNVANYTLGSNGKGTVTTSPSTNYLYINITFENLKNDFFSLTSRNTPSVFGTDLIPVSSVRTVKASALGTDINVNSVIRAGKVLKIDSDEIVDFSSFTLASLPVKAGSTYRFYCDNYLKTAFAIAFRSNNSTEIGPVYNRKTVNDISFHKDGSFDFTVPQGMSYLIYNVYYESGDFDIRNTTNINEYLDEANSVSSILEMPVVDYYARHLIQNLDSKLNKKKWLAIGDSITDYSFRPYPTYKNFTQQLAEKYNMTVYNYGQSGTGFYGRFNVADTITQSEDDMDFITMFMGTNDWGNIQVVPNNKPLGVFGDTGTSTIAGCMNQAFSGLVTKFPRTPIYIITPLPRFDAWGLNPPLNSQGYKLSELVALIKLYANHYSMRVLDLYYESNFKCQTTAMKDIWTVNGDGVHPNDAAHTKLMPLIENFLINNLD